MVEAVGLAGRCSHWYRVDAHRYSGLCRVGQRAAFGFQRMDRGTGYGEKRTKDPVAIVIAAAFASLPLTNRCS